MRTYLLATCVATLMPMSAYALDLVGGGLRVDSVEQVDDSKAVIKLDNGAGQIDAIWVDCIGAEWGYEGSNRGSAVKVDQRSQAIAHRACRDVPYKSAVLQAAGSWRADVQIVDPEKAPEPIRARVPIEDGALTTYTRSGYPRIYAAWGDQGVARIAERERAAAIHVANSGQCDRVVYVGLSERESVPPSEITVFVDCGNRNRFYVGTEELKRDPQLLNVRKKLP